MKIHNYGSDYVFRNQLKNKQCNQTNVDHQVQGRGERVISEPQEIPSQAIPESTEPEETPTEAEAQKKKASRAKARKI